MPTQNNLPRPWREARSGALLLDEAGRPTVHGWSGGRLGYRCDHADRGGQRHQARPVEVERLRDVGPYVVTAAVAGDADFLIGQAIRERAGARLRGEQQEHR